MRVRTILLHWNLVALPFLTAAQPTQLITSVRADGSGRDTAIRGNSAQIESAEANATGSASGAVNTLPLFGERPKTAAQIDAEVHFLNDCDQNFASRHEASDFFSARGWDYISSGQLDTAAHRFNLSWLLNDRNADAYWGLGVVCYQKNQLSDAIRMLKRGLAVSDSNTVLMTDLAALQIKSYQLKPDPAELTDAEKHLQRAVTISPGSADSYQKLSLVSYLKGDFARAWDYFHQARTLNLAVLDLSYLNELLVKSPDPKGIFK